LRATADRICSPQPQTGNALAKGRTEYRQWKLRRILLKATQPPTVSPLNVNHGSKAVNDKKSETVILTYHQATLFAIGGVTIGRTDPGDRKAGWDCTITVTL
jgi:hypothetical protein